MAMKSSVVRLSWTAVMLLNAQSHIPVNNG